MGRGQGRVYRPTNDRGKKSAVWWLDYTVRGKRIRESSKTASKRDAQRVLRDRIKAREDGRIVGRPERVTLAQLRELVERDYARQGHRSAKRMGQAFDNVVEFFGATARVAEITAVDLDRYADKRKAEGRATATINQELAQLRRGFNLAIEKGLLAVRPTFKLPDPHNARQGFFEEGDFALVELELQKLQPAVRDLAVFLYNTAWRFDEARLLQWAYVDMEGCTIRLEGARSKNGKPRVFPFSGAPALKELLVKRWEQRDGLYVFHRDGQPLTVGAVRYAWERATKRANQSGKLVHDFRRSAARNFILAGLDRDEVKALGGWEGDSMLTRYNVVDEARLARAVEKRYGTPTANSEVPSELT